MTVDRLPDYIWKIQITNKNDLFKKKKYYEREDDFKRWLPLHTKEYPEHQVEGYILKDNEWQIV